MRASCVGVPGGVVTAPTSHLDVAPTLLGLLGVSNPPADYAVGQPLDRVTAGRYRLAASWDAVAYLESPKTDRTQALGDLAWSLLAAAEFRFNH